MNKTLFWIGAGILGALLIGALGWFVLSGGEPTTTIDTSTSTQFGSSDVRATTGVHSTTGSNTNVPTAVELSTSKVFKITEGPIAGAALIEITRPTSTIVRFVLQNNGHVFDLALDSPGAIPKAVSNTTIPGIAKVQWTEKGRGALLQYLDSDVVKTAHLSLPPVGSTTPPARLQFLPANIATITVSPDGANIAYLMRTQNGSDGYTAAPNGTAAKKVFSLPLSQLLLSWPAAGTLLAQTPAASGVDGMLFSVNAQSGATVPLVYAPGITAIADRAFSRIIYQTVSNSGVRTTYSHSTRTGLASTLSLDPLPERCVWSRVASSTLYCPAPLQATGSTHVDLWHQGLTNTPDALFSFDVTTSRGQLLAIPGGKDGGEESQVLELISGPNSKYLLFIRKNDRSLWGVRLGS